MKAGRSGGWIPLFGRSCAAGVARIGTILAVMGLVFAAACDKTSVVVESV